jgi:hypothetical protein
METKVRRKRSGNDSPPIPPPHKEVEEKTVESHGTVNPVFKTSTFTLDNLMIGMNKIKPISHSPTTPSIYQWRKTGSSPVNLNIGPHDSTPNSQPNSQPNSNSNSRSASPHMVRQDHSHSIPGEDLEEQDPTAEPIQRLRHGSGKTITEGSSEPSSTDESPREPATWLGSRSVSSDETSMKSIKKMEHHHNGPPDWKEQLNILKQHKHSGTSQSTQFYELPEYQQLLRLTVLENSNKKE